MSAIVFCVPKMDRAKGLTTSYFASPYDNTHWALDMDPNFSAVAKDVNGGTIPFDVDGLSESSGNLVEWLPDGTATSDVDIDFSAIFVANWKDIIGDSNCSIRLFSDDNSGFSSDTERGAAIPFSTMTGPLMARRIASASIANERFWYLWLYTSTTYPAIPEIAFVCVGRSYKVSARWEWGNFGQSHRELNIADETDAGMTFVRNLNSRGIPKYMLNFNLLNSTDAQAIIDAHRDARGRFMPIIVGEITTDDEATGELIEKPRLMRFMTDELEPIKIQSGLYAISVPLMGVPFVERPFAY